MLIKLSKSERETKKIGKDLAKKILAGKIKKRILILEGDLGGGKTTFLKGFAKGLGIKKRILSPTFIIFRSFKISHQKFERFYHFDCYRVSFKDLLKLGFLEIIKNEKNIVAIEWGKKLKKILKDAILIEFEFLREKERKIKILI